MTLVVVSSCSTSNDVVHNGIIQKRKYRHGFHINIAKQRNQKIDKLENKSIGPVEEVVAIENVGSDIPQSIKVAAASEESAKEPLEQKQTTTKAKLGKGSVQVLENPKSGHIPKPVLDQESLGKGTLTGEYQRKGRVALLASLLLLVLPFLSFLLLTGGSPILGFLVGVAAVVSFFTALILGIKSFKFAKSAKWAIFLTILAFVGYVTAVVLMMFVFGTTSSTDKTSEES
ncbi:MAG: hypothetical protein R2813_12270 [Flavobacteriales bacterium]